MSAAVSWQLTPETDPLVGALLLVVVGLTAGILVGPLIVAVGLVGAAVLAGEFLPLLALAAAVVVGMAVSRAEIAAVRTIDDWSPGYGHGRRGLAVAVLVGGLVHVVTGAVTDTIGYNLALVALGVGPALAANALVGEGEVDPEAGVIRYRGDDLPLDAVRSVRTVAFGDRVIALVRYRRGVPTASRLPTFSAPAFEAAEPLLRRDGPAGDGDADGGRDGLQPAVRATAAAMAVGTVALAAGVYSLVPPAARPLGVFLTLTSLPVAVVLAWYAYAG